MNAHYDVRNGVFVTLNVAAIGAVANGAATISPAALIGIGFIGAALCRSWSNVLVMSKHFQEGRELDLRNFVRSIEETNSVFRSAGWRRKLGHRRPARPAVSTALLWTSKLFQIIWWITAATAAASTISEDNARQMAAKDRAANLARCDALQGDMLSAHPRKPEGAALFEAFRCQPRGEGSVMVTPATVHRQVDLTGDHAHFVSDRRTAPEPLRAVTLAKRWGRPKTR